MSEVAPRDAARYLPLMLLLFAGSGFSALVYEIVWYQLLQLAIGSTAVSLGVLLATFMGGLCVGSWGLPRLRRLISLHPLRVYAGCEIGIGVFGVLQLALIPLIDRAYLAGFQSGAPGLLLRAIFCVLSLAAPTILMGASLPAIARWAKSTPRGASWWGLLYGVNTLGAVAGALAAGFWLLRIYDTHVATFVAAAINVAVAGLSLIFAARAPAAAEAEPEAADLPAPAPLTGARWSVLVAIAISGAVSMGAQVVWTRLLGLVFGGTVYAFSIILAVFLVGLGGGALAGSQIARRTDARAALGWSQLLALLGVAWTALQIAVSLPFWPINPGLNSDPWITFQLDLVRCLWCLLPAALAWGAAAPLAFVAAVREGEDPGRTVGVVYAANTLGAIVGALGASLVLIPTVGTQDTERVLAVLSGVAAIVAFAPLLRAPAFRTVAVVGLALALVGGAWLTVWIKPAPPILYAWGRRAAVDSSQAEVIHVGEGINSSIAISRFANGTVQFHVAGKVEASTFPADMSLQRMLGYLPGIFKPDAKSVLIVGFGAGVTAGDFVTFPSMQSITICEIEPIIPPTTTQYFGPQNHFVLKDPRTRIVFDDGRHFVLTTKQKFDVITSDPIHPFVKGSASLYSKEYFEQVRKRLNPGGIVTQWVPLYESDLPTVKSQVATFFQVFPYGAVFANGNNGQGYDTVLVGSMQPIHYDAGDIARRLAQPAYASWADSMHEVGFDSPDELFNTFTADREALKGWMADAAINRDRDLRLQYIAGLSLNEFHADEIYRSMDQYRAAPVSFVLRP